MVLSILECVFTVVLGSCTQLWLVYQNFLRLFFKNRDVWSSSLGTPDSLGLGWVLGPWHPVLKVSASDSVQLGLRTTPLEI